MAGRLEGKIAHITGGGSGLGDAMAHLFANEGARVAVSDLKLSSAERVTNSVISSGGDAIAIAGDVSKRDECERLVGQTVDKLGGFDILINSAGVTPRYAPKDWDFERTWDFVVSINLSLIHI